MMLSRWARAACDQREIRKERLAKRRLVWVEAIMIEEITAHFPNFAELLVGITVEGLELARVDEGVIVVVHVVFFVGVGMKGCTERQTFENGFDLRYRQKGTDGDKDVMTYERKDLEG